MNNLTRTEHTILRVLNELGREAYGLQIVRSSNRQVKRGTMYVYMQRLEEKGLVVSRPEPEPKQSLPRRLYQLTNDGRRVLAQAGYDACQHIWTYHRNPNTPDGPGESVIYCRECGAEKRDDD